MFHDHISVCTGLFLNADREKQLLTLESYFQKAGSPFMNLPGSVDTCSRLDHQLGLHRCGSVYFVPAHRAQPSTLPSTERSAGLAQDGHHLAMRGLSIEVRGLANRSEGVANASEGCWGQADPGLVDKREGLGPVWSRPYG